MANSPDLKRAVFGQGEALSEAWLWVARVSLVALTATVTCYKMGPLKRNHR